MNAARASLYHNQVELAEIEKIDAALTRTLDLLLSPLDLENSVLDCCTILGACVFGLCLINNECFFAFNNLIINQFRN